MAGEVTEIGVSEPWFSAIRSGAKTVEGRLRKGKFAEMRPGTVLHIAGPHSGGPVVEAVVTNVAVYGSFEEYLGQEGLGSTLPGVPTISEGVAVYRQFYSEALELRHGVAAVHLRVSPRGTR